MSRQLLDDALSSPSVKLSEGVQAQLQNLSSPVEDLDQLRGPILDLVKICKSRVEHRRLTP